MFKRAVKNDKPKGENLGTTSLKPTSTHLPGRERLRHFETHITEAHRAIEDLEHRVARFGSIIVESEAAHRKLQDAINADGGKSLAAYSAGQTEPNDEINGLVALAKSSGEAAAAAKIALPRTESLLANARSQLTELINRKAAEVARVLATLADRDAQAYQRAFSTACILHDRLAGFASVAEGNIGDIRLIIDPIKMPRFALPSMGNRDADPFLRHQPSDLTVTASARRWSEIRSRLEANCDADISDLD
jgi:hypothetical protein